MASTLATPSSHLGDITEQPGAVPWYVWCSVAAVTFAMAGVHWDISWHRSIGRDTFWTPAHICIHICGVLAGISCGYLILSTTFNRRSALRDCSVSLWGFRGPLGAFIAAWGGIAMITSAPFDNWWHDAYGLDVKIFSPPHVVLDGGVLAIQIGALVLIASTRNRSSGALRRELDWFLLLLGGMITMLALTVVWGQSAWDTSGHGVVFSQTAAKGVPAHWSALNNPGCTYPQSHTVDGDTLTFGWETTCPQYMIDRLNGSDQRLQGQHQDKLVRTFRFDLPSKGTYTFCSGGGDGSYSQGPQKLEAFDNNTSLGVLYSGVTTAAGQVVDAKGTLWSNSAWPGSQTCRSFTITGSFGPTIFRLKIGDSSNQTPIQNMFVQRTSIAGGAKAVSVTGRVRVPDFRKSALWREEGER